MSINRILIALILSGCLFYSCQPTQNTKTGKPYVVVLSMDGFRWDYPDKAPTPNLNKVAENGVKAERLIPCFPTKTFPNHYSIATGLTIDHHGIVLNNFHAPEFNEDYNKGDRSTVEDGKFYGGEPIWVTAEKQGIRTAIYFWVGSEADIEGVSPSFQKIYDHNFPYSQRIDSVIYWLQMPLVKRPQLIMWYMDEPDWSSHHYGPDGDSLKPVITRMDSLVGVFVDRVKQLPNAGEIDVIILSDHGMAQLSPERQIILDQYIDTTALAIIDGWNPNYNFKVKEGRLDEVYTALKKVDHLQVWKTGELPERLHYGTNPRTHDLVVVADKGWSLFWSWQTGDELGAHGYDNAETDMHAIFYAFGPSFKTHYQSGPIENIDVYPLMARLLGIRPAQVDGNLEKMNLLLKNP